jgi:hypothetical protein
MSLEPYFFSKSGAYVSVQIQPGKISLDFPLHNHSVHGEHEVSFVPRDDNIVPQVVIQQASHGKARHNSSTCKSKFHVRILVGKKLLDALADYINFID